MNNVVDAVVARKEVTKRKQSEAKEEEEEKVKNKCVFKILGMKNSVTVSVECVCSLLLYPRKFCVNFFFLYSLTFFRLFFYY